MRTTGIHTSSLLGLRLTDAQTQTVEFEFKRAFISLLSSSLINLSDSIWLRESLSLSRLRFTFVSRVVISFHTHWLSLDIIYHSLRQQRTMPAYANDIE